MADDLGNWAAFLQWILSNPEKGALFLVIIAGVWRYIREWRSSAHEDTAKESFLDTLLKENKDLRAELKEYRRAKRRKDDEDSGRPT